MVAGGRSLPYVSTTLALKAYI